MESLSPNVSRDGKTIKAQRAYVTSAKADFAKRVVKLSIEITLDESALAVRDDLAFWTFDKTPIRMTLKPVPSQMRLDESVGAETELDHADS